MQALAKSLFAEHSVEHADDAGTLAIANGVENLLHLFSVLDRHLHDESKDTSKIEPEWKKLR